MFQLVTDRLASEGSLWVKRDLFLGIMQKYGITHYGKAKQLIFNAWNMNKFMFDKTVSKTLMRQIHAEIYNVGTVRVIDI